VHVTEVLVAADTGQLIPSMVIVYFEVSLEKSAPVKVTAVPPTTVPNLGLIADRAGVLEPT